MRAALLMPGLQHAEGIMTLLASDGLSIETRDGTVIISVKPSARSMWSVLRLSWSDADLLGDAFKLAASIAANEFAGAKEVASS